MPKYIVSIFILCEILSGCKGKEQEVDLTGHWVLKEAIDNTRNSLSIHAAFKMTDFYTTEIIMDDSATIFNGQAAYTTIPIEEWNGEKAIRIYGDQLKPILYDSKEDQLYFADSTVNRVYRFYRAKKGNIDSTFSPPVAFPAYLNEALIEGRWQLPDSTIVHLDKMGKVHNWPIYSNYEIITNTEEYQHKNGDLIIFSSKDKRHMYGFKRSEKRLFLFDLKTEEDLFINGKLIHSLTKL